MNKRTRLATNATLLALWLLLSGAQVMANDVAVTTTETEIEALSGISDRQSLDCTKATTEAAVNDAVTALIQATRLDLDIRLVGHTSIIVAAGK